jgi:hypothetical protein
MAVKIRGIYATALTALLDDVVQASPPIARRFDESFPVAPADATVATTDDRQGVGVHGTDEAVAAVLDRLDGLARDTFAWEAALSRGGVYAGEITETLGSGALVDCGEGTGFLPYSKTARRVETGARLRVQVSEGRPPWDGGRPVLDTTVRVHGALATLVRGGASDANAPKLAELLPADPPEGWGIEWGRAADDADLEALSETVERLGERAARVDDALADATPPTETAPQTYCPGEATRWVWFGRESRFALDERRREVLATMTGHHRIKAGGSGASTAVDFVERVCDGAADGDFPVGAVTSQFGPHPGDSVEIGHGKPDGRRIELGPGEVTDVADGEVTVERELSGGGTYDALGVPKERGDVATTTFKEGRWWYPTVYRSAEGDLRGTYVNICTPVEAFPDELRYVDLHVDVVKHADGRIERVDDDELDAAVAAGEVSEALAERARAVAGAVESAL